MASPQGETAWPTLGDIQSLDELLELVGGRGLPSYPVVPEPVPH